MQSLCQSSQMVIEIPEGRLVFPISTFIFPFFITIQNTK